MEKSGQRHLLTNNSGMNPTFPLIALICLSIMACTQKKVSEDYYVISEHEYKTGSYKDSIPQPPPPPPMPATIAWYSNIVLIFDTTDYIYLYQTECEFTRSSYNDTEDAPRFIGLTPDHLVTLRNHYIMDFLFGNNNYFLLDTSEMESLRIIFLVSVSDTIKNPVFYTIRNRIREQDKNRGIMSVIRRTTEEENRVLYCKRRGWYYDPLEYTWSNNFIDGNTQPFTKRYDSLVMESSFILKARESFRPGATKIKIRNRSLTPSN